MPTVHINAQPGDFAPVVIMPDDPVQARYIAESCLGNARQVSDVRNLLGFTGHYGGYPVSVMAAGIGIPSVSIYARELFVDYGVEAIISVTECCAIHQSVMVSNIVLAMGACTSSGVNRQRFDGDFAAICDYPLLKSAERYAAARKLPIRIGNVCSLETCAPQLGSLQAMSRMGILATEMNAAGLYGVAAECGRKALAICTVREHIAEGDALPADDRENTLRSALCLALDVATG